MTPRELDKLAEIARGAWFDGRVDSWPETTELYREKWRCAVRAVLDANVSVPQSAPEGGFKPGDMVSVPGVVTMTAKSLPPMVEVKLYGFGTYWTDASALTFIERPAPPEPEWQPGDLAEDDSGARYAYLPGRGDPSCWLYLADEEASPVWLSRDQVPGRLHELTVTRKDEA